MHAERERSYQSNPGPKGESARIRANTHTQTVYNEKMNSNALICICFFFISSVACPVSRGAGQILRACQERTTATHAALPRLVSTRQLCMFLGFQASFHTLRSEGVSLYTSKTKGSSRLLLCSISSSGHTSSARSEWIKVRPMTRLLLSVCSTAKLLFFCTCTQSRSHLLSAAFISIPVVHLKKERRAQIRVIK